MRKTILLPATVGLALLLACVLAILAALASAPTATAASIEHGASFAVRCNFTGKRAQVDPIVAPGGPSEHMHDFFGNITTNENSTYQSMNAAGATTSCSRPEDTAGYWIPTVSWKDSTGTHELAANRGVFYYRAGLKDYRTVQPFAPDLRDIDRDRITWFCGINDDGVGSATPPTRCSGGVLSLKIVFPDCVAGRAPNDTNLQPVPSTSNYGTGEKITINPDPQTGQMQVINPNAIDPKTGLAQVIDSFDADPNTPDHGSHMAKSKLQNGVRVCPSAYPIPVPTLTVNISFNMPTTSGTVVLSSGDASTVHVDLWNTWDQDDPLNLNPTDGRSYGGLNALVTHCINGVPPDQVRPVECRAPGATA
jgi:Domain of unknown function (DUF1996)